MATQAKTIQRSGIEKARTSAIDYLASLREKLGKTSCLNICEEVRDGGYCTHCYTGNTTPQNDKLQL
ncbi:hypothetical protein KY331_00115 [Candidatus Woesearchaeota archaeon]|nr:hypothetical protein [Candidatus Woesearchaeota archaeon]